MKFLKTLSDIEFQALFPVLDGVSLTEVARLRSLMRESPYKRRDMLMKQGERGYQVLFLAHGRIKIVTKSDLTQTVVSFCVHGELLGEINALTLGGHSADVIAQEACFAWGMAVDDFLECLADMPRLSLNVLRILAQRTRKSTEQLHIVATMPAEQRVAYNLDFIVRQIRKSGSLVGRHETFSVSVSDLSSMSGCSSKHVHRALKKLGEAGLIEKAKGRVRVLDFDGLRAFALGKLS